MQVFSTDLLKSDSMVSSELSLVGLKIPKTHEANPSSLTLHYMHMRMHPYVRILIYIVSFRINQHILIVINASLASTSF